LQIEGRGQKTRGDAVEKEERRTERKRPRTTCEGRERQIKKAAKEKTHTPALIYRKNEEVIIRK